MRLRGEGGKSRTGSESSHIVSFVNPSQFAFRFIAVGKDEHSIV